MAESLATDQCCVILLTFFNSVDMHKKYSQFSMQNNICRVVLQQIVKTEKESSQ